MPIQTILVNWPSLHLKTTYICLCLIYLKIIDIKYITIKKRWLETNTERTNKKSTPLTSIIKHNIKFFNK